MIRNLATIRFAIEPYHPFVLIHLGSQVIYQWLKRVGYKAGRLPERSRAEPTRECQRHVGTLAGGVSNGYRTQISQARSEGAGRGRLESLSGDWGFGRGMPGCN
jgi:hypothetical protein